METNNTLTILDPRAQIELPQDKPKLFELRDLIAKELRTEEGVLKELRRPFQEELDRLRETHRPKIEHLTKLKRMVNQKLLQLEKEERAAQAKIDMERLKALAEPKTAKSVVVPERTTTIEKTQKVRKRKVQRWTVLDLSKVPRAYLVLDESKLREAAKLGVKVDGIKFWKEEVPY